MAYKKKVWRFKNAIEVMEYHTGRYGAPGQKRNKKEKPTPDQVKRYNQKRKETVCRHKLREHFEENDLFIALTYAKDKRPEDMQQAKKDFALFARKVSARYKKAGEIAKWIRNIEVGTKGAWHVHVVLNRIPDADVIVKECWPHGKVWYELLYERGEYRDLAAYITKTPETDPRLKEASYSTSRNLPVRDPEEVTIFRWQTWPEELRIRKDTAKNWDIDRESLYESVNRYGHRFRQYTLIRRKEKRKCGEIGLSRHGT